MFFNGPLYADVQELDDQRLCTDVGWSHEDRPEAMDDRDRESPGNVC